MQTGSASISIGGAPYALISNPATVSSRDNAFTINVPLTFTGTITNTSTSVTGCSYVCGAMVGKTITGPGIQAGTTVTATSYSSSTNTGTITLSQPATASAVVVLSMQIPWLFFCELQTKKISNLALGPVSLGDMTQAAPPAGVPSAWAPVAGQDHYVDMFLLPSWCPSVYTTRPGWHWQSACAHSDTWMTHDSNISSTRLSGTVRYLDAFFGNAPNQHYNFGDFEIFGNPAYSLYSQQTGTVTSGSTAVTCAIVITRA